MANNILRIGGLCIYLLNARGRLRTCTFYIRVPRICRERRGVLSRNVCMYYERSSTVELTYNAHLECSAYRRIRQAAMSLEPFSAYQ